MPDEKADTPVRDRMVLAWLGAALADVDRRGLPELKPLLESLAEATHALRAGDWSDDAGT